MSEQLENQSTSVVSVDNKVELNKQASEILDQLVVENNREKTDALLDMFNTAQKKKTAIRADKLNNLLDVITDQAIERFTNHSSEITTQETVQALKTVQELVEKSQKMIAPQNDSTPLIQINQQSNDINVGEGSNIPRESRDKVKAAVASLLANISTSEDTFIVTGEEKQDE